MTTRRTSLLLLSAGVLFAIFFTSRNLLTAAQPDRRDNDARDVQPAGPGAGQACAVYLRGDAMGAAYNDRVPAIGNLAVVRGTVVRSEDAWFVIKVGDKETWIPRVSIVMVEVG